MARAERHDEGARAESVRAVSSATGRPSVDLAPSSAAISGWALDRARRRLSPRTAFALQRAVGNRVTARLATEGARRLGRAVPRILLRLGYPLGTKIPAGAPTPLKDETDHREWNKSDFHTFWEQEQGRKLSDSEKKTIDRGCVGITANNLEGGGNPSLEEVYDNFSSAHDAMVKHNSTWWNTNVSSTKYVMFGMLFWSNQDPDADARKNPDPSAFRGDPVTHKVDMSGYKYRRQPGRVNFDYGFWDDSTQSFWHANHSEQGPDNPMIVYQSTKTRFARVLDLGGGDIRYGYVDFDRAVYGVAVANNYDPTKARALGPQPAPAPPVTPPSPAPPS